MLFNVAVAVVVVARRKARRTGKAVKPVCSDTDMLMDSVSTSVGGKDNLLVNGPAFTLQSSSCIYGEESGKIHSFPAC